MCLCEFHHVRLHQGAYRIEEQPNGELHFVDRRGRRILASEPYPIDPEQGGAAHLQREHEARELQIGMFTPLAQGAGYSFQLAPAVTAMLEQRGRPGDKSGEREEVAELHAEDPEDGPDPPWPEPDATDDQLLRMLAGRGSVDPSELCVRLELPIGETIARLTRLELRGDVRLTAAGYAAVRTDPSR